MQNFKNSNSIAYNLGKLGSFLGKTVATMTKQKAKIKGQANGPKTRTRAQKSRAAKQASMRRSQPASVVERVIAAPVAVGTFRTTGPKNIDEVWVDIALMTIKTDSHGKPYFSNLSSSYTPSDPLSSRDTNLDLFMYNSAGADSVEVGHSQPFGARIQTNCGLWGEWRLARGFKTSFESALNTAVNGSLTYAYNDNPSVNQVGWNAVSACQPNVSGPVYRVSGPNPMTYDIPYDSEWKNTTIITQGGSSASADRMNATNHSFCVASLDPFTNADGSIIQNTVLGTIRYKGWLQLRGAQLQPPLANNFSGNEVDVTVPNTPEARSGSFNSTDFAGHKTQPFTDATPQGVCTGVFQDQANLIIFGGVQTPGESGDGIWRIRCTATDVAGVIIAGYNIAGYTAVGTGLGDTLDSSASAAPPYSAEFTIAIAKTDGLGNAIGVQFVGPNNATAMNCHIQVDKLA